jgi:hypothetical protein
VLSPLVRMIPFTTRGRAQTYDAIGETAVRAALADAETDYTAIQHAYAGYVYGDSTSGQRCIESALPALRWSMSTTTARRARRSCLSPGRRSSTPW